jgi:Holliday junction resolvasome RuvABC endonuclease subunit
MANSKKYYLGLDLATIQTGWAIAIVTNGTIAEMKKGTISFPKSMPLTERLHGLRNQIKEISNQYPIEPILIKEQPLHDHNRKISAAIFKAHGYVESLFPTFNFKEVNPLEAKKFITGYGHASKDFVQKNVSRFLKNPIKFENCDESDAVAVLLKGLIELNAVILN